jgi:ABC-type glycerol-3-phosphate transport system substrate-binding protein
MTGFDEGDRRMTMRQVFAAALVVGLAATAGPALAQSSSTSSSTDTQTIVTPTTSGQTVTTTTQSTSDAAKPKDTKSE